MSQHLATYIVLFVAAAFLLGRYGGWWRSRRGRWNWRNYQGQSVGVRTPHTRQPEPPIIDPVEQLRLVMAAEFKARRILSRAEAQVLYAVERAIRAEKLSWRVMAQVSLGEILQTPDPRAYSAINSKRVDLLLVSSGGHPIAAIEYQGEGHYQGTAPARDAVKKEALRRAGVRYVEITPEHGPDDVAREIARISAMETSGR